MNPIVLRVIVRVTVFLKFFPTPFKHWRPIHRLTPFQLYVASGGDDFYWDQVPESHQGELAVVLGGFKGQSSLEFATRGYNVMAFEPMPSFAKEIRSLAERRQLAIEVIEAAASDSDGELRLEENGERTAREKAGANAKNSVAVKKLDFVHWIKNLESEIAILEINIEGSEFEVLPNLLRSGEIHRIKRLNIQFHKISSDSIELQEGIRESLGITHTLMWSFDWLWEAWEIKPEFDKARETFKALNTGS